jgi:thymidylate synthase ThyX
LMIEVKGQGNIVARIVKDSISEAGVRLTTFELEFHRYILAEYNTHRVFSRNAASTRAIPLVKMLQQIADQPAMPIYYGKNQAGMSAAEELDDDAKAKCEEIIKNMMGYCLAGVAELNKLGLHKQHAGRYLEPWGFVKGVLSFTEGANWNWLRDDAAAQPEIRELARCMREAAEKSVPQVLKAGEWHLPYLTESRREDEKMEQEFWEDNYDGVCLTLAEAIKVSCARCAAVSYRGQDYNLEKCLQLYERLVGSEKKHSSALEHCATPLMDSYKVYLLEGSVNLPNDPDTWEPGISHVDDKEQFWSGNLRGWKQYRKLIAGENHCE